MTVAMVVSDTTTLPPNPALTPDLPRHGLPLLPYPPLYSLMSDYEVTLVNNKMSEFFVKFHGPSESESRPTHAVSF